MIWCLVGIIFITAMVCVAANCRIRKESQEFVDSLDDEQLRVYENVKAQRWNIFIWATVAGIVAGLLAVYAYLQQPKAVVQPYMAGCLFVGVAFIVQYFWYILSPKDRWMVTTLQTERQRKEWNDTYREYQRTYHFGILLGLVGYFALGAGMCQFLGTC